MSMNREFLDKPPFWFQFLAISFPVLYWLIIWTVGGSASMLGVLLFGLGLVIVPVTFLLLAVFCRWFRLLSPVIFFVWLFGGFYFSGLTQGAISASISKAFSSVSAQMDAGKEVENLEHSSDGK